MAGSAAARSPSGSEAGDGAAGHSGRCLMGEFCSGAVCAIGLGGLVAALLAPQSPAQFAAQAVGAAAGAHRYAQSGRSESCLLAAALRQGAGPRAQSLREKGYMAAARLAGASAGCFAAWSTFTPDLDFQVLASSLLATAGASIGSLLAEPEEATDSAAAAAGEGPAEAPSPIGMSECGPAQ
ncbi:unnamed protein product [Prorocentrum cordatum]|uniref:Mitochondrial import inner membrane translocase subunit TIM22 n=1 Tax=Prorocentrum cordatum TaxID=2364126 RepID=A0ABN9UMH8_9DINO|nr:unnamed protein product [Polarella glacialis]